MVDLLGRVHQSEEKAGLQEGARLHLDIADLSEGMYLLKLKQDNLEVVKRFVKLR